MIKQQLSFKKTRIAPTPSGFLHLGNVLSFAITTAIAKQSGAKILLRIDDLDRDRVNPKYVQDIFDTLEFLAIPWDEGPRNYGEYESEYSQLYRMDLYQAALQQLKDSESVFACTCSRAELRRNNADDIYPGSCRDKAISLDATEVSWRLNTDSAKEIHVSTLQESLIKTNLPANMQDFIVRKKDGFPAYQLTSVIDDLYYGVDLIVRGQDLWQSTLAQIHLSSRLEANDFQNYTFHHHALLAEASGIKLSKSAGDTSVRYLRGEGKKPVDVYSEIARLLGFKETIGDWRQLARLVGV